MVFADKNGSRFLNIEKNNVVGVPKSVVIP